MTADLVYVDPEGALRGWLRVHPLLTSVGGRVFFGIPDNGPAYPLVVVSRVGGGPEPGPTPVESALIQLDVWAGSKSTASDVARRVVQALQEMESENLSADVFGCGASVESVIWLPDPDDGQPRYVVTARITVRAT